MCIYCFINSGKAENSTLKEKPMNNLAKVNLCRVDLALFRKHFKKPGDYKDYFFKPMTGTESKETENAENSAAEQSENNDVENVINDIMNYLRHPKDTQCDYKDFEKRDAGIDEKLIVFVREAKSSDRLLSHLRVEHQEKTSYSKLVFLPLLNEDQSMQALYVMSGGQAWRAIYKIADFEFLSSIPLKIADPEGAKCHEVHCLVGEYKSKACIKKVPDNLGDLDVGEVCKKFTAKVSKATNKGMDKSIQKFLFPSIDLKKPITLKVTEGSLTFSAKVSISEVKTLVKSLECIYKDDCDKFPIPDDTKLQRLVLRVTTEKEHDLNEEFKIRLNQHITDCLSNSALLGQGSFNEIELRHQLENESVETSKITLTFKGKKKYYPSKPAFSEVIRFFFGESQANKVSDEVLSEMFVEFKDKKGKKRQATLFSFMTGNFYSQNDDEYYWLLHGAWYFVSEDMLLHVQRTFQTILKDHLILSDASQGRDSAPALYLPWDKITAETLTKEAEYNAKYDNEDKYFNGDKIKVCNIELCDICYHVPNERTYLYHVKRMEGNMTRVVCSQLKNSARLLKDLQLPKYNSDTEKKLQNYGKKVFGADLDRTLEILGMHPERSITRVFVLGLQTHINLTQTLSHEEICGRKFETVEERIKLRCLRAEMDLEQYLSEPYVRSYIEKHKNFRDILKRASFPVDMLIQKLSEFGYLKKNMYSSNSTFWKVTPKLLFLQYNAYKNFLELLPKETALTKDDKLLFCTSLKLMLQEYCTYFASYGSKMDIIRCKNYVSSQVSNVIEQFKICEILVKTREVHANSENENVVIADSPSTPNNPGQGNLVSPKGPAKGTPEKNPIKNGLKFSKGQWTSLYQTFKTEILNRMRLQVPRPAQIQA